MDDFEKEMKIGFIDEAMQLLADAEQCFLTLETNPSDKPTLEKIFRLAHNLKGSAKAVGFIGLGEFTHELESFLIQLKDGKIAVSPASIALLLKCNDHVTKMILILKEDLNANPEYQLLSEELKLAASGQMAEAPVEASASAPTEALPAEIPSADHDGFSEEIKVVKAQPKAAASDESIRVSLSRVEKLLNYIGEIVILQTVLREQSYTDNVALLRKTVHQMGKVTKEVQDLSMSLRMVPLKQTFQKMQRIVRDTSTELNKKVSFVLHGEETEVDKTVLENLGDPLVHLIRNAVDHGIESAQDRIAAGKPEMGTVHLKARHQSGSLIIEIIDDGAGLKAEKLKNKAIEKGILKANQQISDKDAYNLIFHSGFSTKAVVTDVSGRGVGMDVVKTNIEQLQGEIQIETTEGKGTCFRIRLPLTLAIIDGMVIRCNNERYIIPLSHVHESLRPTKDDVHYVSGLGEILSLRGEKLPLYRLRSIFHPSSASELHIEDATAIVVRGEGKAFSVLVDDIIGQHQVVIKQLGQEHQNLKGVSGSAILGDGRPALILELSELIKRVKSRVISPQEKRSPAA